MRKPNKTKQSKAKKPKNNLVIHSLGCNTGEYIDIYIIPRMQCRLNDSTRISACLDCRRENHWLVLLKVLQQTSRVV